MKQNGLHSIIILLLFQRYWHTAHRTAKLMNDSVYLIHERHKRDRAFPQLRYNLLVFLAVLQYDVNFALII